MPSSNNDLEKVRLGLVNYIGALQGVVPFEGKAKNQVIASILVDEVLNTAKTEHGSHYCDPYVLIPLFRGVIGVLRQQQQVQSLKGTQESRDIMLTYEAMIENFEALIEENSGR